jgi:predicted DsbA family dithiol-disulfide isomerase
MIGKVPLDQLAKERNIEVEWRSFELRPEGIQVAPKTPEYYARARAGVEALSKQYQMDMKWNDKSKHSRLAHEGAKFAQVHGRANEYHNAVFAAQFQLDKDINDVENLVDIAEEIGLDASEFRKSLKSHQYLDEVVKNVDEAAEIGITGIPCFIVGNRGVMGVQSEEDLLRLLRGQLE